MIYLISIKPKYSQLILAHKKIVEYRKLAMKEGAKILIYETAPTKLIVGEAFIKAIIKNTPFKIWLETNKNGGCSYDEFYQYFQGKKYAFAHILKDIIKYKTPLKLSDFNLTKPPQSFFILQNKNFMKSG